MNCRRMYDTLKYYQKDLCNYVCAMQALEKAIIDKISESSSGLLAMIGEWYEPEETESEAST